MGIMNSLKSDKAENTGNNKAQTKPDCIVTNVVKEHIDFFNKAVDWAVHEIRLGLGKEVPFSPQYADLDGHKVRIVKCSRCGKNAYLFGNIMLRLHLPLCPHCKKWEVNGYTLVQKGKEMVEVSRGPVKAQTRRMQAQRIANAQAQKAAKALANQEEPKKASTPAPEPKPEPVPNACQALTNSNEPCKGNVAAVVKGFHVCAKHGKMHKSGKNLICIKADSTPEWVRGA